MKFASYNKIEWRLNCQTGVKLIHKAFTNILLSLCRHQNITEHGCIFRTAQTHITEINQPWFSRVRRDDNCAASQGISYLSGNPKFNFSVRKNPLQGLILSLMSPVHTLTIHVSCAIWIQYTPSRITRLCDIWIMHTPPGAVPHEPSTHPHTPRVPVPHVPSTHPHTSQSCAIWTQYTPSHATCPCATCTHYTPSHTMCHCAIWTQYTPSHATCPCATCTLTRHVSCAIWTQYTPSHATCPCATCTHYTPSHATCPQSYESSTRPHMPRVPIF